MESVAETLIAVLIGHETNKNVRKGLLMARNILSSSGYITQRDLEEMPEEEKLRAAMDLAGL